MVGSGVPAVNAVAGESAETREEAAMRLPDPPPGYRARPATRDDLDAVVALINAYSRSIIGADDTTRERQLGFWDEPGRDIASDTLLVETDDGCAVAYAEYILYEPYTINGFEPYVHPDLNERGLMDYLLKAGDAFVRDTAPKAPVGEPVLLEIGIWGADTANRAILEAHGYSVARRWERLRLDMVAPPPAPRWPDGISVRTAAIPDELERIHAAWEDAQRDEWGFSGLTFEEFRHYFVDVEPAYDPTLWFLAIDDASGDIVGYTLCRWERPGQPGEAQVRYVGVRRPWRRRGIARALMLHTFGELWRRGKRAAGLSVDATSLTGADDLYRQLGMHLVQETLVYRRTVREG